MRPYRERKNHVTNTLARESIVALEPTCTLVATPPQRVGRHYSVYLLELGRVGARVDAAHGTELFGAELGEVKDQALPEDALVFRLALAPRLSRRDDRGACWHHAQPARLHVHSQLEAAVRRETGQALLSPRLLAEVVGDAHAVRQRLGGELELARTAKHLPFGVAPRVHAVSEPFLRPALQEGDGLAFVERREEELLHRYNCTALARRRPAAMASHDRGARGCCDPTHRTASRGSSRQPRRL